jgi:monoamine oxidase
MLTFDAMRKINNTIKEHDLLLMFEGNDQVLSRLVSVFNFYNEAYTVGSLVCPHYIKQREQIKNLKIELEAVKAENENLKANIK